MHQSQKHDVDNPLVNVAIVLALTLFVVSLVLLVDYKHPQTYTPVKVYPKNTLLFVMTTSDLNHIKPLAAWASAHGLHVVYWNLDHSPCAFALGDVNLPLTPPVITTPTYLCRAADKNTPIGYTSLDENIFRLVVSHCYGYHGPHYVYDNNTHQVIEVNS